MKKRFGLCYPGPVLKETLKTAYFVKNEATRRLLKPESTSEISAQLILHAINRCRLFRKTAPDLNRSNIINREQKERARAHTHLECKFRILQSQETLRDLSQWVSNKMTTGKENGDTVQKCLHRWRGFKRRFEN